MDLRREILEYFFTNTPIEYLEISENILLLMRKTGYYDIFGIQFSTKLRIWNQKFEKKTNSLVQRGLGKIEFRN